MIEHASVTDYSSYGIATVDPDLAANIKNQMGEFELLVERTSTA